MDSSPLEDDYCSICHDRFTIPCQGNCSHWFCGQCILRVWLHGSALQPCKCPICRRFITLLIPTNAALQERQDSESNRVLENIEQYNRNFGGGPYSLVQMVLSAIYVRSPVDILPEGVFGFIGLLDDLFILLIVLLHLATIYRSVLLYSRGGS